MVGWHHRLNGHEFELAPGDSEGQGSLACCSSWSRKKSDMTEQLNNNKSVICLGISKYHQNQFTSICTTYSLWEQQEEKKLFKRHMENRDQLQKDCHQLVAYSTKNLETADLREKSPNSSHNREESSNLLTSKSQMTYVFDFNFLGSF